MVILLTVGFIAEVSKGQNPVIVSLQGNGRVTWTNTVKSNAYYRVEWAAQAGGPWHTFTYLPIHTIDANDAMTFDAEVPMFYRVVMLTNPPPEGMVWIDSGNVELGQAGIAEPAHTNFISGFWIEEKEVTIDKWKDVYNWAITNGYTFSNVGVGKTNNHPVQTVNWYDCLKWCNARSQKEGFTPIYYIDPIYFNLYKTGEINISSDWVKWPANGYRLPTEAEWEKAARGGRQKRLFPWGKDNIKHTQANYTNNPSYAYDISLTTGYHPSFNSGGFPYTSPVGYFTANGYGLFDMAGNVWEWCWDWYGDYLNINQDNPRGPDSGDFKTLRGGCWYDPAFYARCANRGINYPNNSNGAYGLRCVRSQ